jgi:hypothetical protein
VRHWSYPEGFGCELSLFADWYAVSLTSPPDLAEGHLRQWTTALPGPKWIIAERLTAIDIPMAEVKSEAIQPKGKSPWRKLNLLSWFRHLWK